MTILRLVLVVLVLALPGGLLAACGGGSDDEAGGEGTATPAQSAGVTPIAHDDANAKVTLTIGSKNFTEQKVLGEIFAQGLEAAGYTVRTRLDLGRRARGAESASRAARSTRTPSTRARRCCRSSASSPTSCPRIRRRPTREAKKGFAERGMVAFPPTPFTSSNEVAVTKETAAKLSLQKISDLKGQERELTLAGAPGVPRAARLPARAGARVRAALQRFTPTPIPDRHEVLTSGKADVSIVFTTDPQIQRESEVLLEDDKSMFPPYNSSLVVRESVADAGRGRTCPRPWR